MTRRTTLDLVRKLRHLNVAANRPVTLPYPLYIEILTAAFGPLVDEDWYLNRYPDVAAAIKQGHFRSAAHHYAIGGLAEGRMPCPVEIDESDYLAVHRDVAKAIESGRLNSATEHFYRSGFTEDRAYKLLET